MGLITERLKKTDRMMERRYGLRYEAPAAAFLKRMTSAQELLKDLKKLTLVG